MIRYCCSFPVNVLFVNAFRVPESPLSGAFPSNQIPHSHDSHVLTSVLHFPHSSSLLSTLWTSVHFILLSPQWLFVHFCGGNCTNKMTRMTFACQLFLKVVYLAFCPTDHSKTTRKILHTPCNSIFPPNLTVRIFFLEGMPKNDFGVLCHCGKHYVISRTRGPWVGDKGFIIDSQRISWDCLQDTCHWCMKSYHKFF